MYIDEKTWRKHFLKFLKKKMKQKGWSQEDLAFEMDIERSSISYYLNEKKVPNTFNFVKLVNALDFTKEELVELMIFEKEIDND